MSDSIFTKIIKGEIPSYKIYEDDSTLAFLDIHPIQPGHTLVVPKQQIEFIWDLEDKDYLSLMSSVKLIGKRLKEILNTDFVGVQVIGLDVPHAHVSVIPFSTIEEFRNKQDMDLVPDNKYFEDLLSKLRIN